MSDNTYLSWRAEMVHRKPTTSSSDSQKPSSDSRNGKDLPSSSSKNQTESEDASVKKLPPYDPVLSEYDTSPIFVTWTGQLKALRFLLDEVVGTEYKARLIGRDEVVIVASQPEKCEAIVDTLRQRGIRFARNQFLRERDGLFKVVLLGFEYTTKKRKIRAALRNLGHKVIRMSIVISREGEPQPFFVIKLERRENNFRIFDIKRLLRTNVCFESPYQLKWSDFYTKCYRCKEYGHRGSLCRQLTCAFCSQPHDAFDCPLNRKEVHMKCMICGKCHSADYDCALVEKVEENREKKDFRNDNPPPATFDNYPPMRSITTRPHRPSVPKEPGTSSASTSQTPPTPQTPQTPQTPRLSYAQMVQKPVKAPVKTSLKPPPRPNNPRPNYNAKKGIF